jgi:hypothetical protein
MTNRDEAGGEETRGVATARAVAECAGKSPPPAAAKRSHATGAPGRPGRCYRAANDLVAESLRANELSSK